MALEAIKGGETLQQLAVRYGVHPVMITRLKKELMENALNSLQGDGERQRHPALDRESLPPDRTAESRAGGPESLPYANR